MTDYEYDPDLPYVVVSTTGQVIARFRWLGVAEEFSDRERRIIDTTPKPRVPEDAKYITWYSRPHREHYVALNEGPDSWTIAEVYEGPFEDLPGVTPDTVFTVLEERKS